MAEIERVLAQSAPSSAVLTDVYVCGALGAVVSSLVICNRGSADVLVRVSVAIGGAADTPAQYVYYNLPISGHDTFAATVGISLASGDVIRVYVDTNTVSVSVFGVEIT